MNKLFVYGTLRESKVQKRIIGRVVKKKKQTLKGYKRIKLGKYFALIKDKNHEVQGFVIKITSQELKKADKYEGKEYKRTKVTLNNKARAWTYIKA